MPARLAAPLPGTVRSVQQPSHDRCVWPEPVGAFADFGENPCHRQGQPWTHWARGGMWTGPPRGPRRTSRTRSAPPGPGLTSGRAKSFDARRHRNRRLCPVTLLRRVLRIAGRPSDNDWRAVRLSVQTGMPWTCAIPPSQRPIPENERCRIGGGPRERNAALLDYRVLAGYSRLQTNSPFTTVATGPPRKVRP
jgi:hypothetical protein